MIAVCFATAAWIEPTGRAAEVRQRPMIRVPIAFALVSLSILVAGTITNVTLPAVVLASGALLSVLLRLVLTFRAHQAMLERSRSEATTDPLTGLGNRRALAAALEQRLDEHAHAHAVDPRPVRPRRLQELQRQLWSRGRRRALAAPGDGTGAVLTAPASVYRMGGDEFCALLPGGDSGDALLRAAVAVLTDHGDGFSISASMGSVQLPAETNDVEEALRLADQRMYAHKHRIRHAGAAHEVKRALLSALAQRDPDLSDHLDDVGRLAERTARELGYPAALIERIRLAAELHDIGKMAIPEAILHKRGALTEREWALMHQHTVAGERIIASSQALADVSPLVRSSHERWDGAGYPDGLAGEQIPAGARIITVCDSYHAMTSDRAYRSAMSAEVALAELRAGAGTQFDPEVVDAFLRLHARAHDDATVTEAA